MFTQVEPSLPFKLISFPSYSKYCISVVSILIQHLSKGYLEGLFTCMIKSDEKGAMNLFQLARCVDYLCMITKHNSAEYRIFTRQTIYGLFKQGEGNYHVLFGKIKSVNFHLKNAGLEPIELFAQKKETTNSNFEKDFMRLVRPDSRFQEIERRNQTISHRIYTNLHSLTLRK